MNCPALWAMVMFQFGIVKVSAKGTRMKDYLEMIRVLPTATKAVMAAGLVFAASAVGYLMFLTIVNGAAESSSRSEGKFNRLVIGLAVLVVAGIASRVWKRFRHED